MKKIILNTKNVKDYKINPYIRYEYYYTYRLPILSEFRKLCSEDDVQIDIIDKTISRLNHTPYVLIKVSPRDSVDFIPFCCVIFCDDCLYVNNLFDDFNIFIPKQRNYIFR